MGVLVFVQFVASAAGADGGRVMLTVKVYGPGQVFSDPVGGRHIDCPGVCKLSVPRGTTLELVGIGSGAPPSDPENSDYMVYKWSGCLSESLGDELCSVFWSKESSVFSSDDKLVSVRFVKRPQITVKIVGKGRVQDDPDSPYAAFGVFVGGRVDVDPRKAAPRISCGTGNRGQCDRRWDNDDFLATLTEAPTGGDSFEGWKGCDDTTGGGDKCHLVLDDHTDAKANAFKDMTVTAEFGKDACPIPFDARDAHAASSEVCAINVTYSGTVTASYESDQPNVDDDQLQASFTWSETGKFAADGAYLAPETLAINGTVSETDPYNPSVDCTGTLAPKQTTFSSGGEIQAGEPQIQPGEFADEILVQASMPLDSYMVATGSGDCADIEPYVFNFVPPDGGGDAAWADAVTAHASFAPSQQSSAMPMFPVNQSGSMPIGVCGCEGTDTWSLQVTDDELSVTVTH